MEGNLFEPLKLFLEICKIPHPSNHGIELKKWLIQKAREFGAEVQEDSAGNLLCIKGKPKVCLQGHYDMVYVGDSKEFAIKPIIEMATLVQKILVLGQIMERLWRVCC